MNNFHSFIDRLKISLKEPLPGREAQFLMEPVTRRIELEKQKDRTHAKLSSVLILLYPKEKNIFTVMIKRPVYNGVHSGQMSFPGGRKEDNDPDLIYTALRETKEEIGVNPENVQILGQLSSLYIPPSNFDVLPVIAYTDKAPVFILEKNEVDATLEINITEFINSKNVQYKKGLSRNNQELSIICYNINNEIIWGASAMIISEFAEILKKINPEF